LFLTQFYLGYKEKKNKVNLDRQFEWKLKWIERRPTLASNIHAQIVSQGLLGGLAWKLYTFRGHLQLCHYQVKWRKQNFRIPEFKKKNGAQLTIKIYLQSL
jgi:hypothetical protein